MCKRITIVTAALAASAALGGAAQASQSLDFAAFTCTDFLRSTAAGQEVITLWLDGHLSANPDESKVELDEILEKTPALRTACEGDRDAKITGVFELQEQLWVADRPAPRD